MPKKLHRNNLASGIALVAVTLMLQLASMNAQAQSKVLIKQLNKTGCYNPGDAIQITGKGFGKNTARNDLVLQGNKKRHVISQIKQWDDSKISAQLPTSLSVNDGPSYILGIVENNRWISNRDQQVTLCGTAKKPTTTVKTITPPTPVQKPTRSNDKDTTQAKRPDPFTSSANNSKAEPKNENIAQSQGVSPFQQRTTPGQTGGLTSLDLPPRVELGTTEEAQEQSPTEPNEVVVVTKTIDEAMALAQFVQEYNIRVKRRSRYSGLQLVITVLNIPQEYATADVVQQLSQSFPDLSIDFNHRYQLLNSKPESTSNAKNWAYDILGWSQHQRNCIPRHKLGIIDTGIARINQIEQNNIRHKSMLSNGIKPAKKDHATAIASLILGAPQKQIPGLLPRAELYSAAIFRQRTDNRVDTTAELIIKALNWMAEQQVKVINFSLGGPRNLVVELAIKQLLDRGFVVVSAAGVDTSGKPLYPAAQQGVIAVRAIDANMKPHSPKIVGDYIDYSAPGVDLWLLNEKGDGRYLSGSSFAAPIISASYILLNKKPGTSDLLNSSVRDLGEPGKDKRFGWGLALADKLCS